MIRLFGGWKVQCLRQLLQKHETINQAYLKGKDRVEALGYKAQSELAPHNVNLFVFTDAR